MTHTQATTSTAPRDEREPLIELGEVLDRACRGWQDQDPESQAAADIGALVNRTLRAICRVKAQSLEGAAVQLRALADLACHIDGDAMSDGESLALSALASIAGVIEPAAGISRDKYAGWWFLSTHADPHGGAPKQAEG